MSLTGGRSYPFYLQGDGRGEGAVNGEVVSSADFHLAVSAPVGAERPAACGETEVTTLVVVGATVSDGAVGSGGSVDTVVPDDEANSRNHPYDDER